jgi:hypothetical protein
MPTMKSLAISYLERKEKDLYERSIRLSEEEEIDSAQRH